MLTAGLLSMLLMLPLMARFAHDFLEHHTHELCADELEGEVHYHPIEVTCHFQPLYIQPFSLIQNVHLPDLAREVPLYLEVIPQAVLTADQTVVTLRGPPAV